MEDEEKLIIKIYGSRLVFEIKKHSLKFENLLYSKIITDNNRKIKELI